MLAVAHLPGENHFRSIRAVIEDDSYAVSFQSAGQYRTALLKHIDNLRAAECAAAILTNTEQAMEDTDNLPLAAIGYPSEHPYRVALRRVTELEQMLLSRRIVDITSLMRYTTRPHGGMEVDQQYGPWVVLRDVLGGARTVNSDDEAIAGFADSISVALSHARRHGRRGWNEPHECPIEKLADGLVKNIWSGDLLDAAAYMMMLHHRRAPGAAVAKAMMHLVDGQIALHVKRIEAIKGTLNTLSSLDDADTFAQALIAEGWHNDSAACVDGLHGLLQGFLWRFAGPTGIFGGDNAVAEGTESTPIASNWNGIS